MKNKRLSSSFNPIYIGLAVLLAAVFMFIGCGDNGTDSDVKVPTVTTTAVSSITQTAAQTGGNITSDGGATVTARGVCWCTAGTPTTANDTTCNGTGTGSFTSAVTGLAQETTYYVRAYATNSAGTGYGNIVSFATMGSVTDIDGNTYPTIKIGDQWWMAGNLSVAHYRNGEAIPNVTDRLAWVDLISGAYVEYDNNVDNAAVYGRLYNWYAVMDGRNIAPAGWHVPTDAEWKQLEMHLGMSQTAADQANWRGTDEGGKLKETGTAHWVSPNTGATNASGFTALPGGSRSGSGYYNFIGTDAFFWSSTESPEACCAWARHLGNARADVGRFYADKGAGFSIRCVKD